MLQKPFIIAEIGVNHECQLDRAFKLIDQAVEGGADAAKFQTYKAIDLARTDSPSYWDLKKEKTKTQRELFKKFDCFNLEDYVEIKEYCSKKGIEFMSTPFSNEAFEWIDPLVSRHKLSSSDMTNVELIEKMINSNKPIIASTGAANIQEVDELVETFSKVEDFTLLHCMLSYPTKISDANLVNIRFFKERYPNIKIGYSDHLTSRYIHALFSSYVLGATVLETHFTDDKKALGNDHYHALDKNDLKVLVKWCSDFSNAYGAIRDSFFNCEKVSRVQARRSITSKVNIKAGDILSFDNLTLKRPGDGIHPNRLKDLCGKLAKSDLSEDSLIPDYWLD